MTEELCGLKVGSRDCKIEINIIDADGEDYKLGPEEYVSLSCTLNNVTTGDALFLLSRIRISTLSKGMPYVTVQKKREGQEIRYSYNDFGKVEIKIDDLKLDQEHLIIVRFVLEYSSGKFWSGPWHSMKEKDSTIDWVIGK